MKYYISQIIISQTNEKIKIKLKWNNIKNALF
jgi:hypothetical protein